MSDIKWFYCVVDFVIQAILFESYDLCECYEFIDNHDELLDPVIFYGRDDVPWIITELDKEV